MANARGKAIDNTHLSIDTAEARGFIHRDYIAHCLRWSHVIKDLGAGQQYKTARILDIGCGKDIALAKTLYSSRFITEHYLGLDVNKSSTLDMSPFHTGKFPLDVYGSVDFASDDVEVCPALDGDDAYVSVAGDVYPIPNVVTCFEVIEHVEPKHAIAILKKIREILLLSKGFAYISTPCYDPHTGAAANHVNEITYHALEAKLEDLGFYITGVWGTFASIKDYKDKLGYEFDQLPEIFDKLRSYYDVNYLATIFAPLFPADSRNCLWKICATDIPSDGSRLIQDVPGPWGSSEKWEDWA